MHSRVAYLGVAFVLLGASLLAAPTFGFNTIAADRTTDIDTASDASALLGFEQATESIDGRQDTATAFYLRNNANQPFQLSVENAVGAPDDVQISSDGSGMIAPGEATQVDVKCNDGDGSGTTAITTTITQAAGSTMTIADASATTTVDYTCTGQSNPGQGFQSLSATDVTHYTSPGEERQTVSFVPSSDLQPDSRVIIDLSDAQGNGVDYLATNYPDLRVESGTGDAWYDESTDQIIYQTEGQYNTDRAGETVEISIGGYQTANTAGPLTVSFSREDVGLTGTNNFYVVSDGTQPISSVAIGDVPASAEPDDAVNQPISFTIGMGMNHQDQILIDLSEPQGDGVEYSRTMDWHEMQVQSGAGYLEPRPASDTIVYHPSSGDAAGDEIEITLSGFETAPSGGPWNVSVTHDRTDQSGSDTFRISG